MNKEILPGKMSYEEFTDEVLITIKKLYPDCEVGIREMTKNNQVKLQGLHIRPEDVNFVAILYLEPFYELYEQGMPMDGIISVILKNYEANSPKKKIDFQFFKDFEQVRDRIVYRLINTEMNRELLEDVPHINYWDLSICFSYAFQSDEFGDGMVLLHHSHLESWNVDCKELMKLAEENTPRLFPATFCDMNEILGQKTEELFPDAGMELREDRKLYVLSNEKQQYGAAAMLYPGMLSDIADRLQKDFFIIPSSIFEVLILPVDENPDKEKVTGRLHSIIESVNLTELNGEEILSYEPFYYSYGKKELTKV